MQSTNIQFSPTQAKVISGLLGWFAKGKPQKSFVVVAGLAGTGKTTIAAEFVKKLLAENSKLKVAFAAYTGKAAQVLAEKLVGVPAEFIGTLHSLMYAPILDARGEVSGWQKKQVLPFNLVVVDEASMLPQEIWRDLQSFGLPVLLTGDQGQLPPIQGKSGLLDKPDFVLTEIFRQEEGNPILELAYRARAGQIIAPGKYGPYVERFDPKDDGTSERLQELLEMAAGSDDTLVICGFNHTRQKLNEQMRHYYFEGEVRAGKVQPGDRLVCLRNNHLKQVYNGMLGRLKSIEESDGLSGNQNSVDANDAGDSDLLLARIEFDDGSAYRGEISGKQFGLPSTLPYEQQVKGVDLFDFGYALTVHKAQGSEARRVILFDQRSQHMDEQTYARWLYTAITRAREELYIF